MAKFVKGQSGNPGGRPKAEIDLRALARTYTKEALDTLLKVMRAGDKDSARVAAAVAVLDRGYGKPAQTVDVTTRRAVDEVPEDLVDAAIERLAASLGPAASSSDAGTTAGAGGPEQAPPISTVH